MAGRAPSPQHPPTVISLLLKTWCKVELQGSLDCMEGQTNVQPNRKGRGEKASFLTAACLHYSSSWTKRTSSAQSLSQVTRGSPACTALVGRGQVPAVPIRPTAHLSQPHPSRRCSLAPGRVSCPPPEPASRPLSNATASLGAPLPLRPPHALLQVTVGGTQDFVFLSLTN